MLTGGDNVGTGDADWYHIRLYYSDTKWFGEGYSILADRCTKDIDGGSLELLVLGNEEGRPFEIQIHRPDCSPIIALPSMEVWDNAQENLRWDE